MEITVTRKSMDVGDALRTHVQDMISAMAEKYFERAQEASVVFTMEGGRITADCHIHLPTGLFMTATDTSMTLPGFDSAGK
jgi:Ribosome-associated protein Y (PSrp-1)